MKRFGVITTIAAALVVGARAALRSVEKNISSAVESAWAK